MPVTSQTSVNKYNGNASTTVFSYTFKILAANDLGVYLDGVEQTIGYSVSGVGNPSGGSVTFAVAPGSGVLVRLQREIIIDRSTDYVEGGQLAAETLDSDFDRIVMMVQDLDLATIQEDATGNIDIKNRKMSNLSTPTANTDAATKVYVDDLAADGIAYIDDQLPLYNAAVAAANASAVAAALSETNTAAIYDSFDDRYLGAKAADPLFDNDGNALITGAVYYNSTLQAWFVWSGASWIHPDGLTQRLARDGTEAMLGSLPIVDGTTANPGLKFNTEPTTGIYREGVGQLGVSILGNKIAEFNTLQLETPAIDVATTLKVPVGTTAQRDAVPADGLLRYNTTLLQFEGYFNGAWQSVGGGQLLGNATTKAIFYNSTTIGENLTVASNTNGLTAGPITVNDTFSVTVSDGSVWSIV